MIKLRKIRYMNRYGKTKKRNYTITDAHRFAVHVQSVFNTLNTKKSLTNATLFEVMFTEGFPPNAFGVFQDIPTKNPIYESKRLEARKRNKELASIIGQ